jgi:hypothetical protein
MRSCNMHKWGEPLSSVIKLCPTAKLSEENKRTLPLAASDNFRPPSGGVRLLEGLRFSGAPAPDVVAGRLFISSLSVRRTERLTVLIGPRRLLNALSLYRPKSGVIISHNLLGLHVYSGHCAVLNVGNVKQY